MADEWRTNPLLPVAPQGDALAGQAPTPADAWQFNRDLADRTVDWIHGQRQGAADRGLWDANAGLPTRAGLAEAGQQYMNALIAGTGTGFRAFHGSPHSFDQFSLEKIGTGEGAQAYGHGLYFAGNEAVARSYRDALSPKAEPLRFEYKGQDLYSAAPEMPPEGVSPEDWSRIRQGAWELHARLSLYKEITPELLARTRKNIQGGMVTVQRELAAGRTWSGDARMDRWQLEKDQAALNALDDPEFQVLPPKPSPGSMYEVNINADPAHFLDWDKPLSEQSPHVREALTPQGLGLKPVGPFGEKGYYGWADEAGNRVGPLQTGKPPSYIFAPRETGMSIARGAGSWKPEFAADKLKAAGIPGIRYLDGGSRAAGEGSSNYVVFDPATIELLRKYGIAGLLAGGGAAAVAQPAEQ